MKRSLYIAFALICVACAAFAQFPLAGSIGVFPSCDAIDCAFVDEGGLIQVYIVHVYTTGAQAAQFMLKPAPGWIHLGDSWNFATVIGTSITGVAIAYQGCYTPRVCLGYVNFFGASVPECTYIGIVPDPTTFTGQIEAVDCADPPAKMFPTGGQGIVNSVLRCSCFIPVEQSTWGNVKSLYR